MSACVNTGTYSSTQSVEIQFEAAINGQPFACGQSYANLGTTKSTITPSDFRMHVSQVKLVRKDGTAVPDSLTQDGVSTKPNGAAYYPLKAMDAKQIRSVLIWCKQFKEYIGSADLK